MKYFTINKYRLLKVLCDICLFVFSYVFAFLLRFDFDLSIPVNKYANIYEAMTMFLPVIVLLRFSAFWYFGLFQGSWRYSSIDDLFSIFKAISLSSILIVGSVYAISQFQGFPRSVFLIDWGLLILLTGGVRFIGRVKREVFPGQSNNAKRVLIVGTEESVASVIYELRRSHEKQYKVVALIDDNPEKHGSRIHGIEVMGDRRSIPHAVATKNIDEVIIAQPNGTKRKLWEIIEYCHLANVEFKIFSAAESTGYQRKYIKQIREIHLEDLIGREAVVCDLQKIHKHISERRVLITGAGGSIGSELSRQVAGFNPDELILLDQAENGLFYIGLELNRVFPTLRYRQVIADVTDRFKIQKVLFQYQPDLIFHAAAHKHVPMMELNHTEAIKNNVLGTRNITQAAIKNGVKEFVFISTDKAVKPINFMGVSKRIAEQYIQALGNATNTRFFGVRFGNVLGSTGSVIRLFKEQLEKGGPVTVTHPKATRYFMSISEAVQLILQAALFGKGGEIFILNMGEPVNIHTLAKAMISITGKQSDSNKEVKIVFTGLRPGEKLHEELYEDGEERLPTLHEKIMAINGKGNFSLEELDHYIDELEKGVDEMDRYTLAEKLKAIVPSFQPIPDVTLNYYTGDRMAQVFEEEG